MQIVDDAAARGVALAAKTAVVVIAVRTAIEAISLVSAQCFRLTLSLVDWLLLTWRIGSGLHERLLRARRYGGVRKHGLLERLVVSLEQPHIGLRCQT